MNPLELTKAAADASGRTLAEINPVYGELLDIAQTARAIEPIPDAIADAESRSVGLHQAERYRSQAANLLPDIEGALRDNEFSEYQQDQLRASFALTLAQDGNFDRAKTMVSGMNSQEYEADLWVRLIRYDPSDTALTEALPISRLVNAADDESELLLDIVDQLVKKGDTGRALKVIDDEITRGDYRIEAWTKVARETQDEKLIRYIESAIDAEVFSNPVYKAEYYLSIAKIENDRALFEKAYLAAGDIEEADTRVEILAKLGGLSGSEVLVDEARKEYDEMPDEQKVNSGLDLIDAYIKLGKTDEALELAKSHGTISEFRANIAIAKATHSKEAIQKATLLAKKLDEKWLKASASIDLVELAPSSASITEASRVIRAINRPGDRSTLIIQLARMIHDIGFFEQALETAQQISNKIRRTFQLLSVAGLFLSEASLLEQTYAEETGQ